MAQERVKDLERAAREATREGRLDDAIRWLGELAKLQPGEPAWARRIADVYRHQGDRAGELASLMRAAELYVGAGLVVQAVAACRRILSLDPGDATTRERLGSLLTRSARPDAASAGGARPAADVRDDAPLRALRLAELVPGAHPDLSAEDDDGVVEIPLDGDEPILELGLEVPGEDTPSVSSPCIDAVPAAVAAGRPLEDTPLFGALPSGALLELLERVRWIEVTEGQVIFRQGDPSDVLYVVVDGAVVPVARDDEGRTTRLAVLEPGEFFGEIGLVTDGPRTATIEALVDTRLLCIDRATMWHVLREHPGTLEVLLRFLRERMVDRLVRTNPFFRCFERARRADVARQFRWLEVDEDRVVIRAGRPSPALFAVVHGRLDVVRMDGDRQKLLASLGPGDLCGERSLLLEDPATAAVVSNGRSWLLALDAQRFRALTLRHPEPRAWMLRLIEARDAENRQDDHRGPEPS